MLLAIKAGHTYEIGLLERAENEALPLPVRDSASVLLLGHPRPTRLQLRGRHRFALLHFSRARRIYLAHFLGRFRKSLGIRLQGAQPQLEKCFGIAFVETPNLHLSPPVQGHSQSELSMHPMDFMRLTQPLPFCIFYRAREKGLRWRQFTESRFVFLPVCRKYPAILSLA